MKRECYERLRKEKYRDKLYFFYLGTLFFILSVIYYIYKNNKEKSYGIKKTSSLFNKAF